MLGLFVAQTALVYSHVLGGLYSALLCLGLLCDDARHRRLRPRVYAAFLLAWLTLIGFDPHGQVTDMDAISFIAGALVAVGINRALRS